jgi:hypothetical protein
MFPINRSPEEVHFVSGRFIILYKFLFFLPDITISNIIFIIEMPYRNVECIFLVSVFFKFFIIDDNKMHKVVFKKTIQEKITYGQIERLYK